MTAFDAIGTLKQWSRVSVQGRVHEIQEPMESDRKVGHMFVEFFLQNIRGQGVRVKLVAISENFQRGRRASPSKHQGER